MKDIKVTDSVKYIGVDDHDIDLFESQYVVPNGVSCNSYVKESLPATGVLFAHTVFVVFYNF